MSADIPASAVATATAAPARSAVVGSASAAAASASAAAVSSPAAAAMAPSSPATAVLTADGQPRSPPSSPPLQPRSRELASASTPVLSGLLWKKGSTFGGWTARFYRLHVSTPLGLADPAPASSAVLLYSKTAEGPLRGEIPLSGTGAHFDVTDLAAEARAAGASPAVARALAGQFRLDLPTRTHVFRCEEPAQLPRWIEALQAISRASGNVTQVSKRSAVPDAASTAAATSALVCSACQEPFGSQRSKLVCGRCQQAFCGSLSCMEPRSLTSRDARCCITCVEEAHSRALTPLPANGIAALPSPLNKRGSIARMASMRSLMSSPSNGGTVASGGGGGGTKYRPSNANLLIRVLSGRHLMACDASGSSDPYVVMFFDGAEYRTDVVEQSLQPTWNATFTLPVTGASRDLQLAVYDADRYSNDDFMGMVHIPLSEIKPDRVFEDWFPLKPRPGKEADKGLPISGAIHLQIVLSESLFALFAPVIANQAAPEEAYAQAVLTHHIKRVGALVEALQLGGVQLAVEDLLSYKRPLHSIAALVAIQALVLFFPAEWILPAIPLLLLAQMAVGFLERQEAVLLALQNGTDYHTALLQARNAQALRRKEQLQLQAAQARAVARSSCAATGVDLLDELDEHDPYAASSGAFSPRSQAAAAAAAAAASSALADEAEEELAVAAAADATRSSDQHHLLNGGVDSNSSVAGADGDDDDDDDDGAGGGGDDEKRRAVGFLSKMRRYQKQLTKVQTVIGKLCDKIEAVQNLFRWHDVRRSKLVALVLLLAFVFLLLVPFRLLLCAGITARWSKTLRDAVKKRKKQRQAAAAATTTNGNPTADAAVASSASAGGKKPSEVDNFLQRCQIASSLQPSKINLVEKLRKS